MKLQLFKLLNDFFAKRKIALIYKLGFKFFYDTFEPNTTGVHIPKFLQQEHAKQYARKKTNEALEQIIKNNALDKCYKSALKYERKLMANNLKLRIRNLIGA